MTNPEVLRNQEASREILNALMIQVKDLEDQIAALQLQLDGMGEKLGGLTTRLGQLSTAEAVEAEPVEAEPEAASVSVFDQDKAVDATELTTAQTIIKPENHNDDSEAKESFWTRHSKKVGAIALAGAALFGGIIGYGMNGNNNENNREDVATVDDTTPTTEATTSTTTPENQNENDDSEVTEETNGEFTNRDRFFASLDQMNAIERIGLNANQVKFYQNGDALRGPIEMSSSSFNGGNWNGVETTEDGVIEMSQNVLNADNGYTDGQAEVVRQGLIESGLPENIVDQFSADELDSMLVRVGYIDASSAVYKNMQFNNNDVLDHVAERAVGGYDTLVFITYKDAAGNMQTVVVRGECALQGFDSVTAPDETPPTTVPITTTTTVPETTTTTVPETTTTTTTTSSTVPDTTTTSTTSTTTAPTTTTTTNPTTTTTPKTPVPLPTTPEYPDQEPGDPGIDPNIPDTANEGQDEDGYLPGENPNTTTSVVPEELPDAPINTENNPSDGPVSVPEAVIIGGLGLASMNETKKRYASSAPNGMPPIEFELEDN